MSGGKDVRRLALQCQDEVYFSTVPAVVYGYLERSAPEHGVGMHKENNMREGIGSDELHQFGG